MIGPRVYFAMARDNLFFKMAAEVNPRSGTPVRAIMLQSSLSLFYVFTGTFEWILTFMIFALSIFPLLAVVGLLIRRKKFPEQTIFRSPLFLIFPAIFISFSLLMLVAAFITWTFTSLTALAAVVCGIPVYYIWTYFAGQSMHAYEPT
jgi:APA family basic amino acid/polyamine antiporter